MCVCLLVNFTSEGQKWHFLAMANCNVQVNDARKLLLGDRHICFVMLRIDNRRQSVVSGISLSTVDIACTLTYYT